MPEISDISDTPFSDALAEQQAPRASGPSLADRMRARSQAIAEQRSEVFPVPGYQSMLAVELQGLSVEQSGRIAKRHERVQPESMQALYIGADIVLAATIGFFELDSELRQVKLSEETTWISLALAVKGPSAGNTPRQAILSLLGDVNVLLLSRLWDEWMASEKMEMDKAVVEDFDSTR